MDFLLAAAKRRRGQGLVLSYGYAQTPFAPAFLAHESGGRLVGLAFLAHGADKESLWADYRARWPAAGWQRDDKSAQLWAEKIFARPRRAVKLLLIGTGFQHCVWREAAKIRSGAVASYADLARRLGLSSGARAVGGALAANPVSFVIPCHRVLAASGSLNGYRWGLALKQRLLAAEGH